MPHVDTALFKVLYPTSKPGIQILKSRTLYLHAIFCPCSICLTPDFSFLSHKHAKNPWLTPSMKNKILNFDRQYLNWKYNNRVLSVIRSVLFSRMYVSRRITLHKNMKQSFPSKIKLQKNERELEISVTLFLYFWISQNSNPDVVNNRNLSVKNVYQNHLHLT